MRLRPIAGWRRVPMRKCHICGRELQEGEHSYLMIFFPEGEEAYSYNMCADCAAEDGEPVEMKHYIKRVPEEE